MRRSIFWLPLVVASAIGIIACGGSAAAKRATSTAIANPPADIRIASGEPIVIGVSVALSGDQAGLGADIADAADLAVHDAGGSIRGRTIKTVRVDDGCTDAEKALAAARQLIQDPHDLAGVIGPMCTTGAQAANKVYESAHVIHITPSATRVELAQQGERYFFRTAWRDDVQAMTQSAYARSSLAATSAIVVDDGEPYGKALADAFESAFTAGGRVSRERIERGATDFGTIARKIASANPDIAVYEGFDPEGAGLLKALHDAGFKGKFVGADAILSTRDFIGAGAQSDGAIITGGPTPDDTFTSKFRDAYHREPTTPFVLQSYDAMTVLLKTIGVVARDDGAAMVIDRTALADQLRSGTYAGETGAIAFDDSGDRRGDTASALGLTIYRVANGRFEAIE